MLGCTEPVFLGFPDGEVGVHGEEIRKELADVIAQRKPDMIFTPSPIDYHQDHIATAHVALSLMNDLRSFRLAFYEIYSTIRFTHLIDITGVVEQKKEVIMNYQTSLYGKPEVYVHASLGLNAQRSIFVQKDGYYEAFRIVEEPLGREELMNWLTYGFSVT